MEYMKAPESANSAVRQSWDVEYAKGRYHDELPVEFVADIIEVVKGTPGTLGLYVGCGNGRNFIPLRHAGLDLVGLDLSPTAIELLRERIGAGSHRLIVGDIAAVTDEPIFDPVIGIQVFQHGTRVEAHAHIRAAARRVVAGGMFCVRVNAASTEIVVPHEVTDLGPDGSFTTLYRDGSKEGLAVHFFSQTELRDLMRADFVEIVPLRSRQHWRESPVSGHWDQWEAIWRKTAEVETPTETEE